jgi:hypothetical protein
MSLRQRFLVRESIETHAATFLVGVAGEAVSGEKRLNGTLKLLPFDRRTGTGGRTAAHGENQHE